MEGLVELMASPLFPFSCIFHVRSSERRAYRIFAFSRFSRKESTPRDRRVIMQTLCFSKVVKTHIIFNLDGNPHVPVTRNNNNDKGSENRRDFYIRQKPEFFGKRHNIGGK